MPTVGSRVGGRRADVCHHLGDIRPTYAKGAGERVRRSERQRPPPGGPGCRTGPILQQMCKSRPRKGKDGQQRSRRGGPPPALFTCARPWTRVVFSGLVPTPRPAITGRPLHGISRPLRSASHTGVLPRRPRRRPALRSPDPDSTGFRGLRRTRRVRESRVHLRKMPGSLDLSPSTARPSRVAHHAPTGPATVHTRARNRYGPGAATVPGRGVSPHGRSLHDPAPRRSRPERFATVRAVPGSAAVGSPAHIGPRPPGGRAAPNVGTKPRRSAVAKRGGFAKLCQRTRPRAHRGYRHRCKVPPVPNGTGAALART